MKTWMGIINKVDDFNNPITSEFIDGKTTFGHWAIMTPESYVKYGVGLGIGYGQKYQKQDNKWILVDGGTKIKKGNANLLPKIDAHG